MSSTLLDGHDSVLFDLDGTVHRGGELVVGAKEAIDDTRRVGVPVRYVTNNASKSAQAVAEHLIDLGLDAEAVEVSTSAQAAAGILAGILPAAAKVLVVGSESLESEVDSVGLIPVRDHEKQPVAVIQGHSTETGWRHLAEACLAIRAEALWIACNNDATLPTDRGELPGNGAMVAALRAATQRSPRVAGKPQRALLDAAVASTGASAPLMVGDRLGTDIAGAANAGIPVLMVLTGVSTPADLLAAEPGLRPDYLAGDLRALHRPASESAIDTQAMWTVRGDEFYIELVTSGDAHIDDPLPALRALCAFRWSQGCGPIEVRAGDSFAEVMLGKLGLS